MKKNARKRKQTFLASRRGVIMIAAIAVLVLVINIITASYSWFTPGDVDGTGMRYSYDGQARSEDCSFKTYLGTKVTESNKGSHAGYFVNQIDYEPDERTTAVSISAGDTQYFKTEIINADRYYASDISLCISQIPAAQCMFAVTYPSNTVRLINSGSTTYDYFIVRDAYVKKNVETDVNGPGLLVIEWFVKNNHATNSLSINPSNLYLMYN